MLQTKHGHHQKVEEYKAMKDLKPFKVKGLKGLSENL